MLEGREDVTIRQASEAVRHAVTAKARKCRRLARLQRVREIEYYRPVRVVIIGEQHAARRHFVFGVMRVHAPLVSGLACNDPAVVRGVRVGIYDRDEVVSLIGAIANPNVKIFSGIVLGHGLPAEDECRQNTKDRQKFSNHCIVPKLATRRTVSNIRTVALPIAAPYPVDGQGCVPPVTFRVPPHTHGG
ncbi:hypothetical protein [Qipengyuania zhejiangensis]|uniref:hypothetical protein n=1 Tax=Qipengyuania zhejiangensis TaxID=3077782 RepID=UPI002D78793E|nr:hypothetical protein [Qipengyuania sp. Z2]